MARTVNIHEAKTYLSELVAAAERGEEIIVARRGKPVLRMALVEEPEPATRRAGWAKGISIGEDFDDSIEDLFDVFREDEAPSDERAGPREVD